MKEILIVFIYVLGIAKASAQLRDHQHVVEDDSLRGEAIAQTHPVAVDDSFALVPASLQYGNPSFFKRLFLGKNYREEWSIPVRTRIFDINNTLGGLTITESGGGKQTHSVTLKDKTGKEWKLRTVDKDPTKVLPANLQIPVALDIVQDMISAAHPYAPLTVPAIALAADIPHSEPGFYFVPDDPVLGEYRRLLANKVMILETKDATPDNSESRNSEKLMENIMEDNDHRIDQQSLLKARLLDILIADWDRHIDQWRWGVIDTGKGRIYYPIPVDRDQAFFYSDGLAMKFATMRKLPFMKGLRYSIKKINWLGFSARNFDRMFLNELDETTWKTTIGNFTNAVTDEVITEAVGQLPPEIFPVHGPEITAKLRSRRNELSKAGMAYYKFLSKRVNIFGTNEQEHFIVSAGNGRTKVKVLGSDKSGMPFTIYSRSFDPGETKEIRLFGFKGNDVFKVHKSANDIKLRVVGGEGTDSFFFNADKRVYLYDGTAEASYLTGTNPKNRSSRYPHFTRYRPDDIDYQYNQAFPLINIGFNTEDGLLAGVGFRQHTHSFDKQPFASENRLTTLYSFLGKAYQIRYAGVFTDVIGKLDLIAAAELQAPALANFFGLGNETKRSPNTDMYFYRARYKYLQTDAALKYDVTKTFSVSLGPSFYHYWNNHSDNSKRILGRPELVGLDSSNIYSTKTYAGGRLNLAVNSINNETFPTRGMLWSNDLLHLSGLTHNSRPLARAQSDLTIYKDLYRSKVIGVLRLGGGHIFSDRFEYFQAMTLGANTNLRGYRKTRFAGSSSAYNNLELRVKVADIRSYLFPGTLGVIGFNDVGNVWMRNETSDTWHHSYGGGLYYLPFNIFILSATAGISPEETLFNISLGTKINLIF